MLSGDAAAISATANERPPGRFGGDDVLRLFTNTLDPSVHRFFAGIAG